ADGLARPSGEGAVRPGACAAHSAGLLVLDDQLLCPPVAHAVFTGEPAGDLPVRPANRTPLVQHREPLVPRAPGTSLHAVHVLAPRSHPGRSSTPSILDMLGGI